MQEACGRTIRYRSINGGRVVFWRKLKETRRVVASTAEKNVSVEVSGSTMQENYEIENAAKKNGENMEGLHFDAQTANEKGFYFRINGQNCKITNYKGVETDIRIPDTINGKPVKAIRTRAFAGKPIRSVVFPKNLLRIGEEAFKDCALEKIKLPARIESIAKNAFGGCEKLTEVTLHPEGKKNFEVDWKAFTGTRFIKAVPFVILGDMLLRINLFEKKDELCIPRNIKVIKRDAANYEGKDRPNWSLLLVKHIFIPANVTRVEERAFYSLRDVRNVQIESFKKFHYVYLGKDVFRYSPFRFQLILEKIGKDSLFFCGWQWLKELEVVEHEGGCSLGKCHIYIPKSKRYEFEACLQIKYSSLGGFGFRLDNRDYYEIMLQVKSFREKIEMAKFFAYHSWGRGTREKMQSFLSRYEGRAWKYAVKKQDNELLELYQKYGFWKDKVKF